MKPLSVSPVAFNDLREIADFIALDNPVRAETFVTELSDRFALAAERPRQFQPRYDIGKGLRAVPHGRYLILFRELDDRVRILRVVHGARDLSQLIK